MLPLNMPKPRIPRAVVTASEQATRTLQSSFIQNEIAVVADMSPPARVWLCIGGVRISLEIDQAMLLRDNIAQACKTLLKPNP